MKVSPEQRRQAIEAAAEAAYERDRAAGETSRLTWSHVGVLTRLFYRDRVTAPVDAVLRCVSLPAEEPTP